MLVQMQDSSLYLVDLQTSFDVPEEKEILLIEAFSGYRKGWPNRSLHLLGVEGSEGETLVSHLQTRYVKSPDDGGRIDWSLTLSKGESPSGSTRRQRRSLENKAITIQKALESIKELSIQCDMHCTLAWQLSGESFSTIVQLPLLKLAIPGTQFGQVSGVRFTPFGEDSHQYVVLDLRDKDLYLAYHFVLSGILSLDIMERVVERGQHLKGAFIRQVEAPAGET